MVTELNKYFPIAEVISILLQLYAELIIHDIKKDKIAAIYNSYTKREIGDESLLGKEELSPNQQEVWGPYEKINWNGKRLKSISVILRDSKNKSIGLLCINLDISLLEKCQLLIESFIGNSKLTQPSNFLLQNDWREQINQYIHRYLAEHKLAVNTLTAEQKQKLIIHLYAQGAFKGKNTANYIAHILSVSRATVYNYLKKKGAKD